MASDPYSRMVAFLKVILPLIALAILSTLFLLSDRIEVGSSIPFADGEIMDRVQGQQVTGPFFSGVTSDGDRLAFTADQVTTDGGPGNSATNLSVRIDFNEGGSLKMVAQSGHFQMDEDGATLRGNVLIESTTGYRMRSDEIQTLLSRVDIISPGEVRATGPAGQLTAGALRISADTDSQKTQLLFSQGVKLVYDPKETK